MTSTVQFKNVSFTYPQHLKLKEISFSFEMGQSIGIIGPNGSGKSTLLKMMMGLLPPKTGSIQIFGKKPKEMRHIFGYVPQKLILDPLFPVTTLDFILMGTLSSTNWMGFYRKIDKERARNIIKELGLEKEINQNLSSLSGGQMQRVLLARALVSDPDILILDEPMANVDPKATKAIFALIEKKCSDKLIFMVTHQLEQAVNNVELFLCVQEGKVAMLAPQDVCQHYSIGLYHKPQKISEGEEDGA